MAAERQRRQQRRVSHPKVTDYDKAVDLQKIEDHTKRTKKALLGLHQPEWTEPKGEQIMSARVTYRVALETACHEALVRQAYKDSAGVWTWSIGLTSATGHKVDRYIGSPQSVKYCLEVYVWALKNYAKQVDAVFGGFELTEAQFAAALSFHWNTGAIRTASWVSEFKQGNLREAEARLKAWNKVNGEVSTGLVKRRKKEADLFFRGVWSNDGTVTEITRLNSNHEPIFKSAKKINVSREMLMAFGQGHVPELDQKPQPNNKPSRPTLSAEEIKPQTIIGIIVGLLAAFGALIFARSRDD